jgi:hypothetical protein
MLGHYEQGVIVRALVEMREREPDAVPDRLLPMFTSMGEPAYIITHNDDH